MAGDFERWLGAQVSPVVTEAWVEAETCRGPDSVRVRITVTTRAADVGQSAVIAWDVSALPPTRTSRRGTSRQRRPRYGPRAGDRG